MSLVTLNGVSVLSGTIFMPLVGVWTADLVIDQPDGTGFSAGTKVSLLCNSGFTLNGVVAPNRTGDFLDTVHVRVLGGAGGMSATAKPRAFVQPGAFGRDVVNGLTTDSGETLSSTADSTLLNTNLTAWAVIAAPVARCLELLITLNSPNDNWRFLPDGTLWIGAETWTQSSDEFILINQNPADGTFDLGVDSPSILPGVSLSGVGNVNRVEHAILPDSIRSRVWIDFANSDRGVGPAITAIVKKETAHIDYFALYQGKVVLQSGDMSTVDVVMANPLLAGMSRVPLRQGIPGYQAQIVPGCTVLIGWDAGNPSKPYACLWGGGETVTQAILNLQSLAIGSSSAIDSLIKGTTYRAQQQTLDTALTVFFTALSTFFTAMHGDALLAAIAPITYAASGVMAGACAPALAAVAAFEGASATYLSTVARTI